MRMNNIKIRTQLIIGFSIILLFVIALGIVAYSQTHQLHQQTITMYKHPYQVRSALGRLEADILSIRLAVRDLTLAPNEQERQSVVQQVELSKAQAERQFDILRLLYLGPVSDIDNAYEAFINWETATNETINLALSGEVNKAETSLKDGEALMLKREKMLTGLQIIDNFAEIKADSLYATSIALSAVLTRQLVFLVISIMLFLIIISYFIMRNIRKPLNEMNGAVMRFHQGAMNARSNYNSKNEFGVLSSSINFLADQVQKNTLLNEKSANLASIMLSEEDDRKFFRAILGSLANQTGSHIASIYLLSDDIKTFEHFESIGADSVVKQSFAAEIFEGEFGTALFTRKPQFIKKIPEDTRFVFQTVSGRFIPREIITIPIITNNNVIAVISLACITEFNKFSMELIESNFIAMSTRIEGILAYRTIREFQDVLKKQNWELDTQKNELSAQTTELMQQNAELEMQKKQLHEASRLKTVFLSNMSHELRTPLNSVIALSGVLSRRLANKIPEEEYSYLEIIERNGKNLLALINDILDISRIEAGHEKIEAIKFNANNFIMEVVTMIQPLAKRKNIELLYESNHAEVIIVSDADKFRHILQNLIDNAVKFTEQGKVEILVKRDTDKIEIKVVDTGIGISQKHLSCIFDEFRQADDSTSRRFGGTGLGLAISKKYANLLGGTISVVSIPGKGSEFAFVLPLNYNPDNQVVEEERTVDSKNAVKQSVAQLENNLSEKSILLVEDNESAIIQIKELVQEMGYRIDVAIDGEKALKLIDKTIPDAMILDLMMPGIDGFQVLEILRNAETTAHIPVLILTAKHITKEELKFLKRNNIHELIQKGDVDRAKLQKAIAGMLCRTLVEVVPSTNKLQPIVERPVILVVEDNPDNMITLKALLSEQHTVLEAVDALEGIEMTKKYMPNLILMDIALSGMDGIQAFHLIRNMAQTQNIPIIALTASAMIQDRETILSHGFDAFIAKPIIAKQFYQVINEVLYGK